VVRENYIGRPFGTRELVRPEGLEPPTGGLEIRCSIQLSYGRTAGFAGAPECSTGEGDLQNRSYLGIASAISSLPAR
jgi:hypothetical protein